MSTDLRRSARTYTIRELCKEFDCTPRALRFYEDRGLLSPRREGQNRVYSRQDRGRLQLILRGKRLGMSLTEIGEILDLYKLENGLEQQKARSLPKLREKVIELERQRVELEAAIAALRRDISLIERNLAEARPDPLPRSADYEGAPRRKLDGAGPR